MAAPTNVSVLRRGFVDICRGYSQTVYNGAPLYIRHLSHSDHIEYDLKQSEYEERARAQGAKTEEERLAELRAMGKWTEAKEVEIARQRDTIVRFEDTIRNTPQPSIAQSLGEQLTGERKKLADMLTEKASLIGMTAEVYAQRMINDYYIVTNLFSDMAMQKPLFAAESFDSLPDSSVDQLLTIYHKAIEPCDDTHMRQLSVQEFFTSYWTLSNDNASVFYGRPVCALTYYQIRLGNIARYFKSILEGVDLNKVPPATRGDPDAIERLYLAHQKAKEMEREGKLPGNMSPSDIEQTGLQGQYANVTKPESAVDMVKRLVANRRPG